MASFDELIGQMRARPKPTGKRTIGPGLYLVEITDHYMYQWKKPGANGHSYVVKFTIVESSNPEHAPGTTGDWGCTWESMFGKENICQFVKAATRQTDSSAVELFSFASMNSDEVPAFFREAVSTALAKVKEQTGTDLPKNFLAGQKVRLERTNTVTTTGNNFAVHNWSSVTT